MYLYTFIAEFRDGTYCSQVEANNLASATKYWIEKLKIEKKGIKFLGNKIINQLEILSENDDYKPTNIDQLQNVWFQYLPTSKGSFFVNIVKTVYQN